MLSYQSDSCCDVGKRFANTEDRATRQRRSLPELRAAKGASNASKERFRTGRLDENRMRDSDVHSVHGSAGVSFAGTVIFSQEPIFRRVTAARLLPGARQVRPVPQGSPCCWAYLGLPHSVLGRGADCVRAKDRGLEMFARPASSAQSRSKGWRPKEGREPRWDKSEGSRSILCSLSFVSITIQI
jgi:hypothetical protein